MSAFNGRRAPNVSQYVANLNSIPSAHDAALQQQEGFNLEDDLAMFTNTEFFDFDLGDTAVAAAVAPSHDEAKGLDFLNGGYPFAGFSGFAPGDAPPIHPTPIQSSFSPQNLVPSSIGTPASSLGGPNPGEKRSIDTVLDPHVVDSLEDASRMAAEEDKRRRNTAASARFRVKKKQREQNLERTAKEMTDKASALEARIGQLEMENKWLKSLITEKNENKDDITELWRKFTKESADARSSSERKDGVGTKAEVEKS